MEKEINLMKSVFPGGGVCGKLLRMPSCPTCEGAYNYTETEVKSEISKENYLRFSFFLFLTIIYTLFFVTSHFLLKHYISHGGHCCYFNSDEKGNANNKQE